MAISKFLETIRYRHTQKIFRTKLNTHLKKEYGIDSTKTIILAWGYTTTAFYIESPQGVFIAKIADDSPERIKSRKKDISVSNFLHQKIPTPYFIKSHQNEFITVMDGKSVCVSKFISGDMPFDMNLQTLNEAIQLLQKIHLHPTPPFTLPKYENVRVGLDVGPGPTLLHGDPTPSNFLVAHHKLVAILDFEEAMIGPPDWDISRATVFSWFRMKEINFNEALQTSLKAYTNQLDTKLTKQLCKQHAQTHLDNIIKYKQNYTDQKHWEFEHNFAQEKLKEINLI